jgi:hypothetical protein
MESEDSLPYSKKASVVRYLGSDVSSPYLDNLRP